MSRWILCLCKTRGMFVLFINSVPSSWFWYSVCQVNNFRRGSSPLPMSHSVFKSPAPRVFLPFDSQDGTRGMIAFVDGG